MITIEITNLDEVVKEHRGALTAIIGKLVTDVEAEVEKMIIQELQSEFERRGIRCQMASIGGISVRRFVSR